ncbi:MAG TPA: hypothetical protein DCG54_04025 [Anaerolineae bacterium]|jgi:hypothetical protein|nr:hypothetical protein [Anaerolineae bacterium]
MKRISIILVLLLATLACNFGVPAPVITATETPPPSVSPVDTLPPADEPTEAPTVVSGLARTCENVSMIIPQGLAAEIECQLLPPLSGDEVAPWEATPGHVEIGLSGYAQADKFHRPRLYIFPVVDLAAVQPGSAENIKRVQTILANPGGQFSKKDLPGVHLFNAGAVFASNIEVLNFQNGAGVRTLTVFGQYYAPANNHDLFYHFQGLTDNGQYYIIAILPTTHPGLQADSNEGSLPPAGEFPAYPGFSAAEADMENYYRTTADLLGVAAPETFAPSLADLDALIASIIVTP